MNMQTGTVVNGFRLNSRRQVSEINSTVWLCEHEQSGARLIYVANDDDNKVFSISFRTPPVDDTGLTHILEHSVLCGSRKFPSKEPFVELIKGSLNTFLNAMTFPDKTVYPIASRNHKDFQNLMDVYLDAVFHPKLYDQPEILMQEGWHYELESLEAELSYKGVVYNEMKGALSSPDSLLQRKIRAALFPDTPYGFESGGDPDAIPELTQEQFVAYHRQYYHPANSYIFLYGDLDIAESLAQLDAYLNEYERLDCDSEIAVQPPFARMVEQELNYPVASAERLEDKTYFALCFAAGRSTDPQQYLGLQMLEHLLLGTPASPLKQALLAAGVGKDISGILVDSILQPMLGIKASGSNPNQKQRFVELVYATLRQLAAEGIDRKLIAATINSFEFQLREANYEGLPKGLVYNLKILDSWLYNGDPLMHLVYEPILTTIKAAAEQRLFESMIEELLINNKHCALVTLRPQQGLEAVKSAQLAKQLAQLKQGLSKLELDRLVEQTRLLKQRQQTPDTAADLAKIPLLAIDDIEPTVEVLPLVETTESGATVLYHQQFTNRIAYLTLYFDVQSVPQELLPYLYLLARGVLGKIGTEHYSYTELDNEVNLNTGGIHLDVAPFGLKGTVDEFAPKLIVESKALVEKLPELVNLIIEIVNYSQFGDEQRLKELVQELAAMWEYNINSSGQMFVTNRILSYFSPVAAYAEQGMLEFYEFITDLEVNFSDKLATLQTNLRQVAELVFTKNVLVSIAVDESDYPAFQDVVKTLYSQLSQPKAAAAGYDFSPTQANEGLITSSKVQIVAKAANYRQLGYDYHGSMKVLETILRYDYLWNRVRVKGGAYGGSARFERSGNLVFFSYRDPNLVETLAVYDEMAKYLAVYDADEREMTKYIIGTIGRLDAPLTPSMKARTAADHYIRGLTHIDRQLEREQILKTTPSAIRELADLVAQAMQQNYLCVLGSEDKINRHKDVFKQLLYVFK